MSRHIVVFAGLIAIIAACSGPARSQLTEPTLQTAPSSLDGTTTTSTAKITGSSARQDVTVNMLDACDADTFNAVVGPGTCDRSGGVKFDQFISELTRLGFIGAWHFAPMNANVRVGETFVATNMGGETHTFTKVASFGGGIVPALNQLAHVPTEAPECAALERDDFVAPGGTYRETVEDTGTIKFQCCIHPWMRLEASSR